MSKTIFDVSVIIPFYKRDKYAFDTYEALKIQSNEDSINTEVIFVDSHSREPGFEKKLVNCKNIQYKIFDVDDYVSIKRNLGIKKALSENIIIMDDDCLPQKNFLSDHLKEIKSCNGMNFYCGIVSYENRLLKKSNYFRFRDNQHRIFDNIYNNNEELNFHNIVVMNMGFKKSSFLNSKIEFNEKYNTYGFDDIQFGIDALSKNFKLKTSKAKVIHQDSTSLSKYYTKLLSFGKTYYSLFYKFNYEYFKKVHLDRNSVISKNLNEYKVLLFLSTVNTRLNRNSLIVKIILLAPLILTKFINLTLLFYLISTDKLKFMYSYSLYKFFVRMSLIESFFDKQDINQEWL